MLPQLAPKTHPVDDRPAASRLLVLGFQHVLVMYAGNVAVPLLVAQALKLSQEQTAFLINADLFAAGIATLIQTLGIWRFGARLPVMMGATFLSVSSMIAMGLAPAIGLRAFYGGLLVSGFIAILIAPLSGAVLTLFPPVVTGSLITLLGISLLAVAVNWASSGQLSPTGLSLGLSLVVFAIIVLFNKLASTEWRSLAILIGILAGALASIPFGLVHFDGISQGTWVSLIHPLQFGLPTFQLGAVFSMIVVMLVTLVESAAVFFALAEITGKPFRQHELVQALRADGLGMIFGGLCNAFPYTTFSQNVGLVSATGVRSRFVCAAGGAILILLGLLPKLAYLVAAVPQPVLGGAGLVMFGMVAATGIRILSDVDFHNERNLFIVASSIGLGMIPTLAPHFFAKLPAWTAPVMNSGVVICTIVGVALNVLLNGREPRVHLVGCLSSYEGGK
ncbi:MAG: purine permease [Bryobacterales bacterium]|nr:purine permease [Bryobacterales bacterium]